MDRVVFTPRLCKLYLQFAENFLLTASFGKLQQYFCAHTNSIRDISSQRTLTLLATSLCLSGRPPFSLCKESKWQFCLASLLEISSFPC